MKLIKDEDKCLYENEQEYEISYKEYKCIISNTLKLVVEDFENEDSVVAKISKMDGYQITVFLSKLAQEHAICLCCKEDTYEIIHKEDNLLTFHVCPKCLDAVALEYNRNILVSVIDVDATKVEE